MRREVPQAALTIVAEYASQCRTALISATVTGQIDVRDRPSLYTDSEQTRADITAGRHGVESAAAHVARLQATASAEEPCAPPPAPCYAESY